MSAPIEIEGNWEIIASEAARYKEHKMRLTVFPQSEVPPSEKDNRPIADILAEISARVPTNELPQIPADFCDQLDHYIYGTPKK